MNSVTVNILEYWKLALLDSITTKSVSNASNWKKPEIERGILDKKTLQHLFDGISDEYQKITVSYRPIFSQRIVKHIKGKKGEKEHALIVTKAEVTRDGTIIPIPHETYIPRDILEPVERGSFAIGHIDDLDRFLTRNPFSADEADPELWEKYQSYWQQMLEEVAGNNWRSALEASRHEVIEKPRIRAITDQDGRSDGMIQHVAKLIDDLTKEKPNCPLLEKIARSDTLDTEQSRQRPFPLAERLGHSNDGFHLADHQREVLAHLASMGAGDVLAVNGPPGTGKTTMLLSAIASEWVHAALKQSHPPLIVAASNNNQAVRNIIDAFGKDFAKGDGPFAGRWLPDNPDIEASEIRSFGLYLPAPSKVKDEVDSGYQTEVFFEEIETAHYVDAATTVYLQRASKAFPHLKKPTVADIVAELHKCLQDESNKLTSADNAHWVLRSAQDAVQSVLGANPEIALESLRNDRDKSAVEAEVAKDLEVEWEGFLVREPMWLSLLAFLPPIAARRLLRSRIFLREAGGPESAISAERIEDIGSLLKVFSNERHDSARDADETYKRAETAMLELDRAREAWEAHVRTLLPNVAPGQSTYDDFDRVADCKIRFLLFLLAAHYWEGRWILEMEKLLREGQPQHLKEQATWLWRRRMMLTPCAVSTFFSLPNKMVWNPKWNPKYLLNEIDLLIVDEAGQITPQIAGPSFALAKRALVIGDCHQLEPISEIADHVDYGNLRKLGILTGDVDKGRLDKVGVTASKGNVMRLAQSACRFAPYESELGLDRGLYLFEHRRCFDEIINFSNELCYKGQLQPCRVPGAPPPSESALPPLGYLHVDGIAHENGGSRSNPLEAETIAVWLSANSSNLRERYNGKRLEEIVGIVTPFAAQKSIIERACKSKGIDVSKKTGITIGTVHALQGAEREIVIFSPVYSKHKNGRYIDSAPSMLNVAVSRAKDAFLVFGDMDAFAGASFGEPRSLLLRHLRDVPSKWRVDVPSRDDLVPKGRQGIESLRDALEHDEFLHEEMSKAQRKISIVSPWINAATMTEHGFTGAIVKACGRGVSVEIYTDPKLSAGQRKSEQKSFADACEMLGDIGAKVYKVGQLHSKIVWADDTVLAVGSFNWFSAHRSGQFARHETSYVYRGRHLAAEIQGLERSLQNRMQA